MSELERDLSSTIETLLAQMNEMKAELESLKGQAQVLTPNIRSKPEVSTTRRKLLRRLAGGLVAGLVVGGIGASLPTSAEAKTIFGNKWGAIVMSPGGKFQGTIPSGTVYGLYGTTDAVTDPTYYDANAKIGVIGLLVEAPATTPASTYYGVFGQAKDYGVYGKSIGGFGVYGISQNTSGVRGVSDGYSGVSGKTQTGEGVYGYTSGSGRGVVGECADNTGAAGLFFGSVSVQGSFYSTDKHFKIDHPLDPANKFLYHNSVESSDMKNIYDGIVTLDQQGEAVVELPEWFEPLNTDFRYQLTPLDSASPGLHIGTRLKDRKFKIAGGTPGQAVSWQVTGTRQDEWAKTHRIPVEEDKTESEKGKYLHPELFGQPEEMSVNSRPSVMADKK